MKISVITKKPITDYGKELERNPNLPDIEKIAGLYPRGFISIFAAQAGTGKTWFMQYLACRLSMGGNILAGLIPNSKKYKSVILAGETGKYLLDKRLSATCWAFDGKRIKVYDAIEMQRDEIPIMLNTQEGRTTLVSILAMENPDIVFIDTLISFHSVDESKQSEMTSIFTFLLKSAREFNCAIVLNHHTRKRSTKNPTARLTQDDVIGSNAGARLTNCIYIAERVRNEATCDEGMPTIEVRNVKNWEKEIPPFTYHFITDEASGKIDFAIDWGISHEQAEWSLRDRIGTLIHSLEAGAILTPESVASQLVTSKDNARRYLEEFTQRGMLTKQVLMGKSSWRVKGADEA